MVPLPATIVTGAGAGLLSALLFLWVIPPEVADGKISANALAFPLLHFIPMMPLLVAAFLRGSRVALVAPVIGALLVAIMGPTIGYVQAYGLMSAGPSLVVGWMALQHRDGWPVFSLYRILEVLTFIAAIGVVGYALYFSASGGLEAHLQAQITESIDVFNTQEEALIDPQAEGVLRSMAFLLPAGNVWMWMMMVWLHVALSFWFSSKISSPMRPSLRLDAAQPSTTLLGLIALSGVAALFGSPSLAFLGEVLFIIFLLPYFLAGIVLLHEKSRDWPGRGVALFVIYFTIAMFLWPVFVIACVALIRHAMTIRRGADMRNT